MQFRVTDSERKQPAEVSPGGKKNSGIFEI
jgi:hypothetical protein